MAKKQSDMDKVLAGIEVLSVGQAANAEAISNVAERMNGLEEQEATMLEEVLTPTPTPETSKVVLKNVTPELASLAGQIKRNKGERIIRHANGGLLGAYVAGELPKHIERGEKGLYAVQEGGLTDKFCKGLAQHIEAGGKADEVLPCLPAKEVKAAPDEASAIIQQLQPSSKAQRKAALTQACKRLGPELTQSVLADPDRHYRSNGRMMRMNSGAVRQRLSK